MRRVVIAISCAFALALGAQADPPPKFRTNWADAQKVAAPAGKPIFIHFSISWNALDREMERMLALPSVQKILADFVPLSLDCTAPPRGEEATPEVKAAIERMKACGGESTPFFAVVTSDGDFLYAVRGAVVAEEMIERLVKAKQALTEYNEFQTYASKADIDSPEFKVRLLKFYVKHRKFSEAADLADVLLDADIDGTKGLAGEAKLAQIAIAPPDEGPAKTQALYDEIKAMDPRNEKGLWERAVQAQGERYYRAALRSGDAIEFRVKLGKAAKMIEDLLDTASRFDDRRGVYQMAMFLYTSQQNFDKAHAVIEDLLKTTPAAEKPAVLRLQLGLFIQQEQFTRARGVIAELLKSASSDETLILQKLDRELQVKATLAAPSGGGPATRPVRR